jgi:hypothetical protein
MPKPNNRPTPAPEPAKLPSCTRCGKRDAAPGGKDYWCLECRAEYQRNYRSADEIRARARGWNEGVEAFRKALIQRFGQSGSGVYMGHEVATLVKIEKAPLPD